MAARALVVLAVLLSAGVAPAEAVTPVQKVAQLLTGMVEKGKNEKHEEQVQFAAYKQFCDDTTVEKQRSIAEANEMIDKLKADIADYTEEAAVLTKEIAKHDDDIGAWTGDMGAASKVRAIENEDYLATHKDYTESIEALKAGIKTLQGQNKVTAQATLAQITSSSLIPEPLKAAVAKYFSEGGNSFDENLAVEMQQQQPAAAAYEFQSQGLVDMLEKLIAKFKDEQTQLEKDETGQRQAFELLKQDLETYLGTATKARTEKTEAKGKALEAAGDAKSDLEQTTATRDDDKKYLSDLTATCEKKSSDFEARQKLRGDEIAAIEKAIEILSSGAVAGAAEKHLPTLLQQKHAAALAQLRSVDKAPSQVQVAAYLREQGSRIGSRILNALAVRVEDDPFKKVKKMIQDLVTKLMEEANGEQEHKGWCDNELSTNEQTRKTKTETVEILHAEIDELEAAVANLSEEITDLTKAVAESDAAVAKATEMREAEKAKNTATIADAKAASTAVASALATLKEFYAKAGSATSLVQKSGQKRQPEIFDEAYTGMQSESGGVVGMIEVIASDFARLDAETTAAEEEASKEFSGFMNDSAVDKAQKSADIDSKTASKQNREQELTEKKTDLDGTQKELDAALQYYDKLKPSCVDSGVSYDDRVAMRKEEIDSLQEALRILEGEAVL